MAATADVVIQNFRPGVVDRLGIGEDALARGIELDLRIHLRLWRRRPVTTRFDPIIQAISGLTTVKQDPTLSAPDSFEPLCGQAHRHCRGASD